MNCDFREGDDGDDNSLIADREVDHLTNGVHNGEKMDSQSHISDSTCTIDIDRDNEDKTKLDEGKTIIIFLGANAINMPFLRYS